jgi:hypothetical protein
MNMVEFLKHVSSGQNQFASGGLLLMIVGGLGCLVALSWQSTTVAANSPAIETTADSSPANKAGTERRTSLA